MSLVSLIWLTWLFTDYSLPSLLKEPASSTDQQINKLLPKSYSGFQNFVVFGALPRVWFGLSVGHLAALFFAITPLQTERVSYFFVRTHNTPCFRRSPHRIFLWEKSIIFLSYWFLSEIVLAFFFVNSINYRKILLFLFLAFNWALLKFRCRN